MKLTRVPRRARLCGIGMAMWPLVAGPSSIDRSELHTIAMQATHAASLLGVRRVSVG